MDKDRAENLFRDCWPIFEKKQEAEFRKNCYNWYKEIQTEHPQELPAITPSLFQSPGGRKFINFITSFVRYVAKEVLRQNSNDEEILWEPSDLSFESSKSAIKGLIIQDAENIKSEYDNFLPFAEKCQTLSGILAPNFRNYKANLSEVQEITKTRSAECEKLINEPKNKNPLETLKAKCEALKSESLELEENFQNEAGELKFWLKKIQSIKGETLKLDVTHYGFEHDSSLKNIFEKLLNSAQDLKLDREPKQFNFPMEEISSVFEKAEKQRLKLTLMIETLSQNEVENKESIKDLQQKVSEINWKETFALKELQVLMPPTPGIKIKTTSTLPKTKFLLDKTCQDMSKTCSDMSKPVQDQDSSIMTKPRMFSQSEYSTCSDLSQLQQKQSTPEISRMRIQSPEQSRIIEPLPKPDTGI